MGPFRRRAVSSRRIARGVVTTLALVGAVAACRPPAPRSLPTSPWEVETPAVTLVGHAAMPTELKLGPHEVGGLSALAYNQASDLFYAIVDDPGTHPPARLLRFRWHPPAVPVPVDWLVLRDGRDPLPATGADLEGIALLADGQLFVSSEGDVKHGLGPWVGRFAVDGALGRRLRLPGAFALRGGHGIGHNQGFEALALEPGGSTLLAGVEGPLAQDLPAPPGELARTRVLCWDLRSRGQPRQWLYPLDAPHAEPSKAGGVQVAGLVDLLPWRGHLLALERSWVEGVGFAVKLYEATLEGADEVTGVDAVAGRSVRAARKRLLADFGALGVPMDNYEGMTWAPVGPQGEMWLVVVSDNNFNVEETTYLAAFRVGTATY